MESVFRYRSQQITTAQVEFIRQLMAAHPEATRRRLSFLLCEAWGWKQTNGAPRDMVCRGLLLGLHRAGHIALPVARLQSFNPAARYRGPCGKAEAVAVDTTPLAVPLSAEAPPEAGEKKYDESAAAMIALMKYGSGVPWDRLERLEASLGIPLPASTQCEIVAETAEGIRPVFEELIRQAAQDEVFYNDDTGMKILSLARASPRRAEEEEEAPGSKERTGLFTSGIVSTREGRRIALFFTGRRHAGETLAQVLAERAKGLPPLIQMSDALSRNVPKLKEKLEIHWGNGNAHARRRFVEVTPNFPEECRRVLESFGKVYRTEAEAAVQGLTPEARLRFHQEHSQPVMDALHAWFLAQFAEKKVEPNSGRIEMHGESLRKKCGDKGPEQKTGV